MQGSKLLDLCPWYYFLGAFSPSVIPIRSMLKLQLQVEYIFIIDITIKWRIQLDSLLSGKVFEMIICYKIQMLKLIVLTIILPIVLSVPSCSIYCASCNTQNNPYSCRSCSLGTAPYVWSCSPRDDNINTYIPIAVIILVMHLFMLAMGQGMYRQLFQNIQLVALISWRYNFQKGTLAFSITNLSLATNNNFLDTFGYQFIILILVFSVFGTLIISTDRMIHSPTAILLHRKKIIFPVRVITLTYNIILFASLIQINTLSQSQFLAFPFVLAILGLISAVSMFFTIVTLSNYKKYQADDPNYYVLNEQLINRKWYTRNNITLNLGLRSIIIIVYVVLFQLPQMAGIIILVMQIIYSTYYIVMIRFVKIRYYLINIVGQVLTISIYLISYVGAISQIGSATRSNFSNGYVVTIILLVALYFVSTVVQIVVRKDVIVKQLKSIYLRFIKCEKLQEKIIVNKYDDNSQKERVTQFRANLLYKKEVKDVNNIQMPNIQS